MKDRKQSVLPELLSYAGGFKILTYLSLILSALSSVLSLMPFVFLWRIIREVLEVQPDFSRATGIVHNGWMAVLFAVLAALVYVGALVCSHGSAFRTAANMKKALMRHIARLPIGFADEMGSGKLRRIVTEVTGSTGTKALLQNCCQSARIGQKKRAAANLPAIVSLIMQTVSDFTCLWDLRKRIVSYASERICSFSL